MPEQQLTKEHFSEVSVKSNIVPVDSTAMSFDETAIVHLMGLLTDLYSNPNLAVLREYATNALDSHVAAGNASPIEITMPSVFEPTFIVEDHGVGMSHDDIMSIYSRYGASTKRQDLSQVGAFGLGCKSALTLTQQFTLVSIKDGEKCVVLVSRDEEGTGKVSIISHTSTPEANGVTVTIPIPDVHRFRTESANFFLTWKPGTVKVNGLEPESIYSSDYITEDGITFMASRPNYGSPSLIIAGIAYIVDQRYANNFRHAKCYIDTPIGTVDLTPSRESLRYSYRTKRYIESAAARVDSTVEIVAYKAISEAPTRKKALQAFSNWGAKVKTIAPGGERIRTTVKWGNETIPDVVEKNNTINDCYVERRADQFTVVDGLKIREHANVKSFYIIETDDEMMEKVRRSIRLAVNEKSSSHPTFRFLVFANEPTDKWILENGNFERLVAADVIETAREVRRKKRQEYVRNNTIVTGSSPHLSASTYYVVRFNDNSTVESNTSETFDTVPNEPIIVPNKEFKNTSGCVVTNLRVPTLSDGDLIEFCKKNSLQGKTVIFLRSSQSLSTLARRLSVPVDSLLMIKDWSSSSIARISANTSEMALAYVEVSSTYGRTIHPHDQGIITTLKQISSIAPQIQDSNFREILEAVVAADLFTTVVPRGHANRRISSEKTEGFRLLLRELYLKYPLLGNRYNSSGYNNALYPEMLVHLVTYVNAVHAATD